MLGSTSFIHALKKLAREEFVPFRCEINQFPCPGDSEGRKLVGVMPGSDARLKLRAAWRVYAVRRDSSRRRAPAAAGTEWIEGAFIEPCHLARVGTPVAPLREGRARAASEAGHAASAELRRSRTVPLRRTQTERRDTARRS